MGKGGSGQANALRAKQLQRVQLVTRAADGEGWVECKYAHHLELPQHGHAMMRDRLANARDDRIKPFQFFTLKHQRWLV